MTLLLVMPWLGRALRVCRPLIPCSLTLLVEVKVRPPPIYHVVAWPVDMVHADTFILLVCLEHTHCVQRNAHDSQVTALTHICFIVLPALFPVVQDPPSWLFVFEHQVFPHSNFAFDKQHNACRTHQGLSSLCDEMPVDVGQGFVSSAQPQGSTLNWQQQLQQQQAYGSTVGLPPQGMPQAAPGSVNSPSAAAADSWSWLDDFEHKQQAEHVTG